MEMIVNRSSALKVLVATVLLTGLFYFGVRYDVQNTLRQILTWIRGLGAIGPLVFAAIYVLAAVALLPGLILTTGGHCHVKSADFDWIIDTPGLVGWFEMTAPPHLQFGTVALGPGYGPELEQRPAAVPVGCMRRSPVDSTHRSPATS